MITAPLVLFTMLGSASCSASLEASMSENPQQTAEAIVAPSANFTPDYVTDVQDQRRLAGLADAIFVGEVLEQIGTKSITEGIPETQFRVQVVESLKGDLSGQVTVNQAMIDGDTPIAPGTSYIFSTLSLPSENWHTIVPNVGRIDLSPDDAHKVENGAQSRSANTDEPESVRNMKDSIANEIPFTP